MATKIHHLNCATMCPYNARLLMGEGGWTETAELCAHVLLIESSDGLVLVDTGIGSADCADPGRLGPVFKHVIRPRYELAETAVEQVKALGFDPADVRHILVTHLDADHAGGLGDFPAATVHVFADELRASQRPDPRERLRYLKAQWAHGPDWRPYPDAGDSWFGFQSVRAIEGLDVEIAIVPLAGHTRGHSAIAVDRGDRWLLHCGDAYFNRGTLQTPPAVPVGIKAFELMVELQHRKRLSNQERLRQLQRSHGDEISIFCAHDPSELADLRNS